MRQLRSVPPDLSVMPIRNRNCRRCRSPRRLAIRVLGALPESQSSPLHCAPGGLYCVYARVLNILSPLDWHVNNFTSEHMAPFRTPDSRLVIPLATHAGRRAEWP